MSKVVRVRSAKQSAYLLKGGAEYRSLLRMVDMGLAQIKNGEIDIPEAEAAEFTGAFKTEGAPPFLARSAILSNNGVVILPGEELRFGQHGKYYNELMDASWLNNPSLKPGVALSDKFDIKKGDIVLTLWPSDKTMMPARVDSRGSLELVSPKDAGQRCCVIDAQGTGLITISKESDGSDFIRTVSPRSLLSWLFSLGTKAVRKRNTSFAVKRDGGEFVLSDFSRKKKFRGALGDDPDRELEQIELTLAVNGMGGLLAKYVLRNER